MENKKIRQIKTILTTVTGFDDVTLFDKEVNTELADGWYLAKRYSLPRNTTTAACVLIAELQRFVDHE